jgi:DNA ligase-associated metallophosphoesterase
MDTVMEIEIRGQHFELLPQKAVYWKERRMLLIADLHLGKITHFRKEGIAVPSVAYRKNFIILDELIEKTQAEEILFLGDLFHHRHNREWDVFGQWRKKNESVGMSIVTGNHDRWSQHFFGENSMSAFEELVLDDFLFCHHPRVEDEFNLFVFCGHVHPVYCLRSAAKQAIKLPCFVKDGHQMVLPSFGVFTGGYEMEMQVGRKIFVVVEDGIKVVKGNNY